MAPEVSLLTGGDPETDGLVEPLFLHRSADGRSADERAADPLGPAGDWVVLVHAPGENRTGNNYRLAEIASGLARSGFPSLRFDLAGYGESLRRMDIGTWQRQIAGAAAEARSRGAARVWFLAFGLHSALLPSVPHAAGPRVAVHPPTPKDLAWWGRARTTTASAATAGPTPLFEADGADPEQRAFWQACGAEPNLVGGLLLPRQLLDTLVEGIAQAALLPRWEQTVVTEQAVGDSPFPVPVACGADPLTRPSDERTGLITALLDLMSTTDRAGAR